MGISTTYYTIYGVVIPYDNEISDAIYETDLYQTFDKSDAACNIIADGMSGEYMIIGKIFFDGGDLRWGDYKDTWSIIPTDAKVLEDYREAATKMFLEHLPERADILNGEWKIITFLHTS